MRTILMAAVSVLAVGTSACGAIRFDVEQDLAEQTVQGNALGGLLPKIVDSPFTLNIDVTAETEKRGTGPATNALLKSLTFAITPHDAPKGNFDFVNNLHLFIEAPGVTKVEIAKVTSVPKGSTTISFDVVPDINLLPFINAGASISVTGDAVQPNQTTSFDGKVVIEIRI